MFSNGNKTIKINNVDNTTHYTPHIQPFQFPNLWRWRYLIYLFVKRDFSIYFQQTILGPLWYLLQPLASSTVLLIVFGRIARLPTDSIPPFLFYLLGSIIWYYFSDCFTRTSRSLLENSNEFGYAAFPRITVPCASIFSALIQFAIQFTLFIAIYFWYFHGSFSRMSHLFLIVPGVAQCAIAGMGGGMLVAALTSKYRDLAHLVGFCIQLLYFCTPLVYPLSMVPQKWRQLYSLNPLTSATEIMRHLFFSTSSLSYNEYLAGWIVTVILFVGGIIVFNIVEKTHIDTI